MAEKPTTHVTSTLTPPFSAHPALSASTTSSSPVSTRAHGIGQLHVDASSVVPLNPLESLPTITGGRNEIVLAKNAVEEFLKADLDLSRLNRIHGHLWMAGRPMRARPLHRYKMLGFDILQTQQMDLHLLKFSNKLLLKPVSEWILSAEFWTEHICGDEELHKSACGFLVSYVWLVTTPLDLKLAHEHDLLPLWITWQWWKDFVADFYTHVDINTLHQVNKRYNFGELRLSRVNSIYRIRFFTTHFVRGYLYGYNRYVVFFQRNFSWILIVFVFFSLVLSAMQVGTGLKDLEDNYAFLRASYVFVVFSMVCVVAVLGFVALTFVGIFLFNMVAAISHANTEQAARKKLAKQKLDGKEV